VPRTENGLSSKKRKCKSWGNQESGLENEKKKGKGGKMGKGGGQGRGKKKVW